MRREFTCSDCGAVLATISPDGLLRPEPVVAMLFDPKRWSLRFRCACGQVESFGRQRKVELVLIGEWEGFAA